MRGGQTDHSAHKRIRQGNRIDTLTHGGQEGQVIYMDTIITEAHVEEAERILGYYEALDEAGTLSDRAREWALQDALTLLRDLVPEWSAFKEAV